MPEVSALVCAAAGRTARTEIAIAIESNDARMCAPVGGSRKTSPRMTHRPRIRAANVTIPPESGTVPSPSLHPAVEQFAQTAAVGATRSHSRPVGDNEHVFAMGEWLDPRDAVEIDDGRPMDARKVPGVESSLDIAHRAPQEVRGAAGV